MLGRDPLNPPGISGGSKADNAKVVRTGEFVQIGEFQGEPLFIELITPDPDFAAFQHCPRLAG